MQTLTNETLKIITERLVKEFQPEKILLFGSYAWGTPEEHSDVDILVIVAHSDLSPVQRAVRAHKALRGINVPKDILVKTKEEVERYSGVRASLEAEILERGRVLYG